MDMRTDPSNGYVMDAGASDTTVFDVLSNTRRRHALYELRNHDRTLSIHHLALTVAAWESERSISAVDDDLYQEIMTGLHHTHLPKLVHAGLIDYDEDRERVSLIASAAEIEIVLGELSEFEFA